MTRLLCVWLPNWPIQRLRLRADSDVAPEPISAPAPIPAPELNPALNPASAPRRGPRRSDPPTVLWRDDPRRGRRVVACCPRAKSRGVREGMSLTQAAELCTPDVGDRPSGPGGHPPGPRVHEHEPTIDGESLARLAVRFQQRISPLVAIETLDRRPWAGHPRHQSESLLCDITGVAHLFGGEAGVLKAVDGLLRGWGLRGRLAIAESVGAAWAVSHAASTAVPPGRSSQTTPHPASTDPAGVLVPPGAARRFLEPLSVEALRIPAATAETLSRLGVLHIGPLLRLPRSGLAPRLGQALVRRLEQALGEVDEPLNVHRGPAEHRAVLELEYPTTDRRILADRITRLIDRLRIGLTARQHGALCVDCCLDLADHCRVEFQIGLFTPTIDTAHLSGLMVHQLESRALPASVHRMTVEVTLTGPLRSVQASLFTDSPERSGGRSDRPASPLSGPAVSRLIDSLSGRLGRERVVAVTIEDDPLPERAYRVSPLAGRRSDRAATTSPRDVASAESFAPSSADAVRRPLRLFPQPVPLAVAGPGGPFSRHAAARELPRRILFRGQVHQVLRSWGPERIETGWWKGPSVRRDYYRIETDRGQWWWIFRNLASQSGPPRPQASSTWMLHGRFA